MSGATREKWRIAVRNLARNKRRNLATGSAIALGFAALLALGGYIHRVENYLRVYTLYGTRVGHLTVYKKDALDYYSIRPREYSLAEAELGKLREIVNALPGVSMHGPQLLGTGLVGNGCKSVPFIGTGIDPLLDKRLREHPEMKRWAPDLRKNLKGREISEYPADFGALAVSDGLARLLGKTKVISELPPDAPVVIVDCMAEDAKAQIAADANVQLAAGSWDGTLGAIDGEIVAQYSTGVTATNDSALLTSLTRMQQLYGTRNATLYSVWLEDESTLAETGKTLRARIDAARMDLEVFDWKDNDMSPMYTGTMEFLYTMVGFITVILSTVIVLSIFNSATMTVIERSQEIGMMRSLGFTRREIRMLFIREGLLLALFSVIIGGIIGAFGIAGVNVSEIRFNPPGVAGGMQLLLSPSPKMAVAASILTFALAIVTTFAAVRRMTQSNIATLLQGTQR